MLPNQKEAYNKFYESARFNNVLTDKTSLLIHMAAAMSVACIPCMEYYMTQAEKYGVTTDEISAVESIVMAVSAGRVKMQFREILAQKDSQGKSCCG